VFPEWLPKKYGWRVLQSKFFLGSGVRRLENLTGGIRLKVCQYSVLVVMVMTVMIGDDEGTGLRLRNGYRCTRC